MINFYELHNNNNKESLLNYSKENCIFLDVLRDLDYWGEPEYSKEIIDVVSGNKKFEKILLNINDSYLCVKYARFILGGRFIEAEDIILCNVDDLYEYIIYVVRKPFYKGHKFLSQSAQYSYYYAIQILNHRFVEAENIIKNSGFRYLYENCFKIKL
jgi:hypothetical protein